MVFDPALGGAASADLYRIPNAAEGIDSGLNVRFNAALIAQVVDHTITRAHW